MLNKLLLVMIIAITLNASAKEVVQNINSTYTNGFYDKLSNLSSLPLYNYENNTTLKKVKEDFEKVIPSYLTSEGIFSKPSLEELEKNKIDKYKISKFFNISISYIKYLNLEKNYQLSTKIMERNLINLKDLMNNSENMIDYLIALGIYSKIFSNYDNPTLEMVSIFKKYPPPNNQIYFKKVEAEKLFVLKIVDNMNKVDQENMKDYDSSDYKKLMMKVRASAKSDINKYFSKMLIAISSKSEFEIENFNKYVKIENDKLISTWNQIKFMIHSILAKLLQIFIGYNIQHDYMAEYMGKLLALIAIPHVANIYSQHIKMEQAYKNLLKSAR